MTTKQHTPGPWETSVCQSCGEVDAWDVCAAGGGDMLADLKGNPNGEADANLMASAPDLLYALANVTEFMQQALAGTIHQDNVEFFGAMARTAIAKARGEA
jgi:hypothetical protein